MSSTGLPVKRYPRPDFQRRQLQWVSLDGPWHFLFDDEDVGLSQRWQATGLPSETTISAPDPSESWNNSEAESITQKIAALPERLAKDNTFKRTTESTNKKRTIEVPYVFQCPASGINDRSAHEVLWYERSIEDLRTDKATTKGDRLIVRFGAVDYEAKIWVDGQYFGGHRGGHVPFDLDITDAFHGETATHRLTMRVFDSTSDLTQPRGKQYWGAKPESIFYTPSSGIWQSVWLEAVPAARIADSSNGTILRSNDIDTGVLHASVVVSGRRSGQKLSVQMEAHLHGELVSKSESTQLPQDSRRVNIDLSMRLSEKQMQAVSEELPQDKKSYWRNGVALWSVEKPTLYDIEIRLFDASGTQIDHIHTETGMRSLRWNSGDGTFQLNDKPIFQALCLDQGYWPDTFMTPPSQEHFKTDIELAKNMGFNGCRKHQKVEDPAFLWWADHLGYLVWGEMGNAYSFSNDYVDRFNQEWMEAIRRDINHPCIVTWTPVNESWGYTSLKDNVEERNHIRSLYYLTKTLDPTRPINDNCGWEHVCTDLTTFHDYADGPELTKTCATLDGILAEKAGRNVFTAVTSSGGVTDGGASHKSGAPVICTEFGGVNIAAGTDENAGELDWGYTTASDSADLLKRFEKLVMGVVEGGHVCGFVYTQLTDIEQEVNGLYSFDRKAKLDPTEVKKVIEAAQAAYYKHIGRAGGHVEL
ncbi:beta-galactosidase [Massariosphaeria phaeospora]|uniref:Beta-galactosidase n=1 Tax=Massariosphaeria phaeospora TaxID=100035 RepID=A0A7C8I7Q8_9PLEO|nr:beta-galactosidase [Massariosphaeria phaeospora]